MDRVVAIIVPIVSQESRRIKSELGFIRHCAFGPVRIFPVAGGKTVMRARQPGYLADPRAIAFSSFGGRLGAGEHEVNGFPPKGAIRSDVIVALVPRRGRISVAERLAA